MLKKITCFCLVACLTISGALPAVAQQQENRTFPQNSPFTPAITRLVNMLASASIVKTACKVGNGRLSDEFIKNQAIVDGAAIQQILDMGYSEKVAQEYLQQWKQSISGNIQTHISQDPLFCNGDFVMYVTNIYRTFIHYPERVVADVKKDLEKEEEQSTPHRSDKTLELIERLKSGQE